MQVNPNLADWFAGDPVERIVNLENSLIARKREVEKFFFRCWSIFRAFQFSSFQIAKVEKERLGTAESRSPSPGIRFEEEQVRKTRILMTFCQSLKISKPTIPNLGHGP